MLGIRAAGKTAQVIKPPHYKPTVHFSVSAGKQAGSLPPPTALLSACAFTWGPICSPFHTPRAHLHTHRGCLCLKTPTTSENVHRIAGGALEMGAAERNWAHYNKNDNDWSNTCICIVYMHICVYIYMVVCAHMIYHYITAFIKKLGSLECQAWTHHSRYFLEKSKKKGNSRGQDEYPPRWLSLSSEICELDLMKGRVSEGGETVHSGQHLSTCIFSDSHPWEADSRYPGTTHSGLKWGGVLLVGWLVCLNLV